MAALPTPEQLASLPPEFLAEDMSDKLQITAILFIVLNSLFFLLFVLSRIYFVKRSTSTAWIFYPASYLVNMGLCTVSLLMVSQGGIGRHTAYWLIKDPKVITTFLKLQTASEPLYMASVTLPKINILLLYLSIFNDRNARRATWATLGVVVVFFFIIVCTVYPTICRPFAFRYDKSIPNGQCDQLLQVYKWFSIPNILLDVVILLLPVSTVMKLQISNTKRVGVIFTFLFGGLGIIGAIIRCVGFWTIDLSTDIQYNAVTTMIFTIMEPTAYFICSCLPGIRPLVWEAGRQVKYGSTLRSRSTKTGNSSYRDSLGRQKSTYMTSVTTSGPRKTPLDDDEAAFIRLEESVCVESNSIKSHNEIV